MTYKEAVTIINKITYKPNWKIEAEALPYHYYDVQVLFKIKDVIDSGDGHMTELARRIVISSTHLELIEQKELILHILDHIDKMEKHETREWFKFDNKVVYPQH